MNDLISRQAAIDAMSVIIDSICEQEAIDALYALPSAEVEPVKHGRWIPFERTMEHVVCTCTVCGRRVTMPTWYNCCPNCGAKMDQFR